MDINIDTSDALSRQIAPVEQQNAPVVQQLGQRQKAVKEAQPFTVTFRHGLIKRCVGCGKEFSEKSRTPPNDLILRKKSYREYPKPDRNWVTSKSLSNGYYCNEPGSEGGLNLTKTDDVYSLSLSSTTNTVH